MTNSSAPNRPFPVAGAAGFGVSPGEQPVLADSHATDVRVLQSEKIVTGRIWDVRRDTFLLNGEELVRDYVDHTGAVGVLAIDDEGRVLLLRQYRHPIAARDWEIPAGLMDVRGESGLAGAKRELAEEADLQAGEWHLLTEIYMTPGGSSEAIRIFLARDLSPVEHGFVREGEEAEIVTQWVELDDAVTAVLERRVQNSLTTNAVLAAYAARARGWDTLGDPEQPWDRRDAVRGARS